MATLLAPPLPGPGDAIAPFHLQALTEPASIPALVMLNNGGYLAPGSWDSPDALRAALPASGGVMNARSLAGLYAAQADHLVVLPAPLERDDRGLMSADTSAEAISMWRADDLPPAAQRFGGIAGGDGVGQVPHLTLAGEGDVL